jgi:hypothetical protein
MLLQLKIELRLKPGSITAFGRQDESLERFRMLIHEHMQNWHYLYHHH